MLDLNRKKTRVHIYLLYLLYLASCRVSEFLFLNHNLTELSIHNHLIICTHIFFIFTALI